MKSPRKKYSENNHSQKSSIAGLEGDYVNHIKPSSREDTIKQLDYYYGLVKRQLLRYQSPTSHLFPALSTETEYASIRDSVYCSAAVWSLFQVLNIASKQ